MHAHKLQRNQGFTLLELMIVVGLIAILSAIAVPNMLSARVATNESAAIASMRNIWTGQAQFKAAVAADVDGDGAGEFGFFREISGSQGIRAVADGSTAGKVLVPAVITAFRNIDANGAVQRSGYHFVIRLPAAGGAAVLETPSGAFASSVDADLAETTFCIYAWPSSAGGTGNRTFFVNQQGDTTWTESAQYSGAQFHANMKNGMAFSVGGSTASITGMIAVGTVGRDGNSWRQVN